MHNEVISFQSSAAMWRASTAMHCTYNHTLTPTSTEYDVKVQCRHQYPFRHITWIHNFYGRFIQTKLCTAKLSTPVGGNNNTRYKYVEVYTTVSIQEYSSCKQYDRKFGDRLKILFNFVTSKSKQNPHTRSHKNKFTHKQKRYKNEICRPENYFLTNTRHCCFQKLSFKNFSLMSMHVFFFCSIPYNYLKSITCYVILFIQNVVLRANYTLVYAFNWFSFARQGPLVPIHYTTSGVPQCGSTVERGLRN